MRNHPQPLRRNSALHWELDDLILWLKYENNFDDSSFYEQQITGFHPNPIIETNATKINYPSFDKDNYTHDKHSALFNLEKIKPLQTIYVHNEVDEDSFVYDNRATSKTSVRTSPRWHSTRISTSSNRNAKDLTKYPHFEYDDYIFEFAFLDTAGSASKLIRVYKKSDLSDSGLIQTKTIDSNFSGRSIEKLTEGSTLREGDVDLFNRTNIFVDPSEELADPHYDKVSLLIQSLQEDGLAGTSIRDRSKYNHQTTSVANAFHTSAREAKSGDTCIEIAKSYSGGGGYFKIKDHESFDLNVDPDEDFTIECWFNLPKNRIPLYQRQGYGYGTDRQAPVWIFNRAFSDDHCVHDNYRPGAYGIQYRNFYGVGHLICYMRGTYPQNVPGANPLLTAYPAIASLTSRIDVAADYWNHISFSKKDGTFLLHLNGELKDSRAVNLASPEFSKISSLSKDLHVGNLNCSNPPGWADVEEGGFLLEDFRITKGVSRYDTSDFIPLPIESAQAPQANKGMWISVEPYSQRGEVWTLTKESNGEIDFTHAYNLDSALADWNSQNGTNWYFYKDIKYDSGSKYFYASMVDGNRASGMAVINIITSKAEFLDIKKLEAYGGRQDRCLRKGDAREIDNFEVINGHVYTVEDYRFGSYCGDSGTNLYYETLRRVGHWELLGTKKLHYRNSAGLDILNDEYNASKWTCKASNIKLAKLLHEGEFYLCAYYESNCLEGGRLSLYPISSDGKVSTKIALGGADNVPSEKSYDRIWGKDNLIFAEYTPDTSSFAGSKEKISDAYLYDGFSFKNVYDANDKIEQEQKAFYFRSADYNYAWAQETNIDNTITSNAASTNPYLITTLPGETKYQKSIYPEAHLISGSGVFSLDESTDSAEQFDIEQDFTIECWAKFNEIPKGHDDDPGMVLWDFGNLKFSNTSGYFSVHGPDGDVTDHFETKFIEDEGNGKSYIQNKFVHYAVQRRNGQIELWMDDYDEDGKKFFDLAAIDESAHGTITGIKSPHPDHLKYNNCRSIGSTISGTNFFSGWIDEVRVWKEALYGPGTIVEDKPGANGIHHKFNTFSRYDYRYGYRKTVAYTSQQTNLPGTFIYACENDDIYLWVNVKTIYDPRWSVLKPLPYVVEWYKDNQLLYTYESQNGRIAGGQGIPGGIANQQGNGELKLHAGQDTDGWYHAVVKIGPRQRPKYIFHSRSTTGGLAPVYLWSQDCPIVYPPPPPPPKATLEGTCGPQQVNVGSDAKITATFWNPNAPWVNTFYSSVNTVWYKKPSLVCPPLPITWKWTNKGRGVQKDGCDPDAKTYIEQDMVIQPCWPYSELKFNNIRKSIKGPICVEAIDANGKSAGKHCCPGIKVRLPNLQCPVITNITPAVSTSKYNVSYTEGWPSRYYFYWWRWYYQYYYCRYLTGNIFPKPNTTQIDVSFSFDISDPNIPELETGGYKTTWKLYGCYNCSGQGATPGRQNVTSTGGTLREYTIYEDFNGYVECKIEWNNYPSGTYTADPEGRAHYSKASVIKWNINFPECQEPYASANYVNTSSFNQYRSRWYNAHYTRSRYWWSQLPVRVTGGHTQHGARTEFLGGGRENDISEMNISVPPCTKLFLPINYYKSTSNRESMQLNSNYGKDRGLTKSVSFSTSGNLPSVGGPDIYLSPYGHGRYANTWWAWSYPDTIVYWLDLLKGHDGTLTITLSNDCGLRTLKYNITVTSPSTSYGGIKWYPSYYLYNSSSGGWWWYNRRNYTSIGSGNGWSTSGIDINFYYQETKIYNWWTGKNDTWFKKWPTYIQHYVQATGYIDNCGGAFRLIKNGQTIKDWGDDLSYSSGGLRVISRVYSQNYYWNSSFRLKRAYFTLIMYPDQSFWNLGTNSFELQTSSDLPCADCYDQGKIHSIKYNVGFWRLPDLISQTNSIWWYCGGWWYGYYYWWRYYPYWYHNWCWYYMGRMGWQKVQYAYTKPSSTRILPGEGYSLLST